MGLPDRCNQQELKRSGINYVGTQFLIIMNSSDPFGCFNFLIEIDGIVSCGFTECSGLQIECEVLEYPEGGQNEYLRSFIGPVRHTPIVLRHGMTLSDGLWNWYKEIVKEGLTRGFLRRNMTIYLLDSGRRPRKAWNIMRAFPYKWSGPELRADASDVAFESVELNHQGLEQVSL